MHGKQHPRAGRNTQPPTKSEKLKLSGSQEFIIKSEGEEEARVQDSTSPTFYILFQLQQIDCGTRAIQIIAHKCLWAIANEEGCWRVKSWREKGQRGSFRRRLNG